jgi:predicted acyl esterase
VLYTFKKGHRIMIQVQSSWFPLVDRNPQVFENIYEAKPSDFKKGYDSFIPSERYASSLETGVLPSDEQQVFDVPVR